MILFNENFKTYTKINIIVTSRLYYTLFGRLISNFCKILFPLESNFQEDYMEITKVREGTFFMSGRILYYKPLSNYIYIPFKYFDCFGGYRDFKSFEPTFEFYWETFKNKLSYSNFFKSICEIKHKPSIFLYIQLQQLANLYDVYNQPINRLMD
jgi:hypothetical protein